MWRSSGTIEFAVRFFFYRFIGLSVVGLIGNAIARIQDTHNLTERNCTNNWIQNLPHSGARAEAEKAERAEKATISPFAYFRQRRQQRQRINGNGNDSRQQENSAAECTRVHFNWFLFFSFLTHSLVGSEWVSERASVYLVTRGVCVTFAIAFLTHLEWVSFCVWVSFFPLHTPFQRQKRISLPVLGQFCIMLASLYIFFNF